MSIGVKYLAEILHGFLGWRCDVSSNLAFYSRLFVIETDSRDVLIGFIVRNAQAMTSSVLLPIGKSMELLIPGIAAIRFRRNNFVVDVNFVRCVLHALYDSSYEMLQEELLAYNMRRLEVLTTELEEEHRLELNDIKKSMEQNYMGEFRVVFMRTTVDQGEIRTSNFNVIKNFIKLSSM